MNKICGIYKITSPSGKIYIGQSVNILSRKSRYVNLQCEQQIKIYRSILKYGWVAHTFEIIHECNRNELNNWERHFIILFNTFNSEHGLNLTNGGDSASREISEETRIKMRKSLLGNKRTLNYKYDEVRKREIHKRIQNKKKGYSHSEETRQKISKSHMGIKNSNESIEKMKRTKAERIYNSRAGNYEIYNQNDELIHKFNGDFRKTLENLKIPYKSFSKTYKFNRKIKKGNYIGWYAIKL